MAMIEFGSISAANHRFPGRCRPVFLPNRPLQRRFGPLRASEGLDSRLLEVHQPLQVVAGRHHRHRKVRAPLSDGTDQLAAHLLDAREHVLHSGTRLGDAVVAPLLKLGKGLVAVPLPLDLITIAVILEPALPVCAGVASVRIDIAARVAPVDERIEVLAVMDAGRISLEFADDLVLLVHVDRELVAEVVLAVLLRPGGIRILLAPFGWLPVSRHRAFPDQLVLLTAVTLLGSRHQRGIDDLAAAGDESVPEQLGRDTVEQDLRAGVADAVLERPHGRSIRNIDRAGQPAESLVAHPVKQLVLHLFIRQVVQPLEHQNPHHRLRRIRRATALRADRARRYPIDFRRKCREIDVRLDLGQRISKRVDLLPMMFVSEQVRLDGSALLHGWCQRTKSGQRNFTNRRGAEVFRGALKEVCSAPSVWEGWQRWRAWLRHARDRGLALRQKPQALYPRHPRQRPFSHAYQPAGGREQPNQGAQAHGLWFPGLGLLLPESQGCLPRESAMNLFYRCLDQIDRWLCAIDDLL